MMAMIVMVISINNILHYYHLSQVPNNIEYYFVFGAPFMDPEFFPESIRVARNLWSEGDRNISEFMMKTFVNFAKWGWVKWIFIWISKWMEISLFSPFFHFFTSAIAAAILLLPLLSLSFYFYFICTLLLFPLLLLSFPFSLSVSAIFSCPVITLLALPPQQPNSDSSTNHQGELGASVRRESQVPKHQHHL